MNSTEAADALGVQFENSIIDIVNFRDETSLEIELDQSFEILSYCKEKLNFDYLVDITAVDNLGKDPRYEVVYELYSYQYGCHLRIKKVIHTSTSEVYGTAKRIPIDENHPVDGQSPYSASKIAADQMAISFYKSFGLPISIIRPFNTYGPRQSARAIIPTIILQLLSGKKEIALGSTGTTRDFSYIDDTVDAFVNSIAAKNIEGEIINLGSGTETSIKDLVEIISTQMNIKCKIVKDKKRIRPLKSEFVGNYALRVYWSDSHDTGIFHYKMLRTFNNL